MSKNVTKNKNIFPSFFFRPKNNKNVTLNRDYILVYSKSKGSFSIIIRFLNLLIF